MGKLKQTSHGHAYTYLYKYNTTPPVPTQRIKALTQQVLLKEGVLTDWQVRKQKIKDFFQNTFFEKKPLH